MELEEHLFRHEAGRLVSILARLFGLSNLALAEDVVQDAFCRALETWKFHGVPANPTAWLMATAKNRARDVLRRERATRPASLELSPDLQSEWTLAAAVDEAFDAGGIRDAQLRMMFSCIHPRLAEEAQLALVLHLLCGFSIDETAAAFLKGADAMEKRIGRAKKTLAGSRQLFDLGGANDLSARQPAVLRVLYLMFNEGYHGASQHSVVRADLCGEALRLLGLLIENPQTVTPAGHALAALMQFHSARLPGRVDASGDLVPFALQDRSRWDRNHIATGHRHLASSATGDELTAYHLEAAVAALHADAARAEDTDWAGVVSLYDSLLRLQPTPVVALARAIAVAERDGPAQGLAELSRIADRERLTRYPFYFSAAGEFELRLGHTGAARLMFESALKRARNPAERRFLEERLRQCNPA